ncbi:MAG: WGR domain-containing protein [Spirochaetales bacterium]|nr:WGR domain-containing protein [Spirochaetales bacterium]
MIIALYKITSHDEISYYYIHDYQGHLFSPYTFTAIWGKNLSMGKEKSFSFSTQSDMDKRIHELFKTKLKQGFKLLYTYPPRNDYQDMFIHLAEKQVS